MDALNISHPLWFPKVMLNSAADAADAAGNDGLVSVNSVHWGEFLGMLEGADHWALCGASGIELNIDLPDAWSFAINWGRRQDNNGGGTKDEVVGLSMDRLLVVVDWLVEQVTVGSQGTFSFAGAPPPDGFGGAAGESPHSHWPASSNNAEAAGRS